MKVPSPGSPFRRGPCGNCHLSDECSSCENTKNSLHNETVVRPPLATVKAKTTLVDLEKLRNQVAPPKGYKESPIPVPGKFTPTKATQPPPILPPKSENRSTPTKASHKITQLSPKTTNQELDEESFSQAIQFMRQDTTAKMDHIFSDSEDEQDQEPEGESFSQAINFIKKAAVNMSHLFSEAEDSFAESEHFHDGRKSSSRKYKDKVGNMLDPNRMQKAREVYRAKKVFSDNDGVHLVPEDWEETVGKVYTSLDHDTEAQEGVLPPPLPLPTVLTTKPDIAFSATYINSKPRTGIQISNTRFQFHDLRSKEGWVASSSNDDETNYEMPEDRGKWKLKLCTVIRGRVRIKIGKEDFLMGKGGVFRVKSGENCVIRNEEKKVATVWVVCVE